MENKNTYTKDHPYMRSLDKALTQYFVVKCNDVGGAIHGEDYEEMKEAILDALFYPPAVAFHGYQVQGREELDNWKERYKGYREWKKKIPMEELAHLEEEYNMKGNEPVTTKDEDPIHYWYDKDNRMV